jgi:hypothetical protein
MFARFVPLQSIHSTSKVDVWETLSDNQIRIPSLQPDKDPKFGQGREIKTRRTRPSFEN